MKIYDEEYRKKTYVNPLDPDKFTADQDAWRASGQSFCSVCQVSGAQLYCLSLDGIDEFYDDLCEDCVDRLDRMVV